MLFLNLCQQKENLNVGQSSESQGHWCVVWTRMGRFITKSGKTSRAVLKAKGIVFLWFPHRLENGSAFSNQGILNILEKSGNFTQNIGEVRKLYLIFLCKFNSHI